MSTMQVIDTSENYWDYMAEDNFLVIPISEYVKKSGELSTYGEFGKSAAEKYPSLLSQWGYFLNAGVELPVYRIPNKGGLLGGVEKEHYASAMSEELVYRSLLHINEFVLNNPTVFVYLPGWLGGEDFQELHEKTLQSDRIVVLKGVEP